MRLRFGEFVLDTVERLLARNGAEVALEPQVLACIELLARQPGKLTRMEQLREALWPGVSVADGSLRRTIREARKALGDDGDAQAVIRTRKGVGYVFLPEVVDEAPEAFADWPFVGRARELEFLRQWLGQPSAGGLCFISGEAGAGKSRLLAQLSAAEPARAKRWLFGRCQATLGLPAFWPFRELAKQLMEDPRLRAPALAQLRQTPELARLIPELEGRREPERTAPSASARFELCQAFAGFVRGVARAQPLAIAIEDAHWADDGSLVLLEALAQNASERSMHVLVSYRPEDAPAGLRALIARTSGRAAVVSLDLAPLTQADLRTLLDALGLLGSASKLEALTGGNALYVHELARHALATGSTLEAALPPSLQQIIAARLETLPGATTERLGQAAVLGESFALAALAALTQLSAAELDRDLEPALRHGLLRRAHEQPGQLGFSHALVRDALVRLLAPQRAAAYHRAALAVLPAVSTSSGELAVHAFEAGELVPVDERRRACERAGRDALASYAFERASLQLGRALQLTPEGDHSEAAAELALACAFARWHADEAESIVEAAFLAAAERARRAGSSRLLAEAAIGLAVGDQSTTALRVASLRPKLLELAHEAWQRLEHEPAGGQLAYRLAWTLSVLRAEAGPLADAQLAAANALRLAPRELDPPGELWRLGLCVLAEPEPERVRAHLDQLEAQLQASALDPRRRCELAGLLMWARLTHGDLAGWERAMSSAARFAALLPQPASTGRAGQRLSSYVALPLCAPITRAVLAGQLAQAEQQLFRAGEETTRRGLTSSEEWQHDGFHILLQIYAYQGRSAVLEPIVDQRMQTRGESRWFCALLKAQFALERGEHTAAREHFALLRESGFQPLLGDQALLAKPETLLRVADVCNAIGTAADAERLYTALAPRAAQCIQDGVLISWGSCARVLGALALQREHWDDAERHFAGALAMNAQLGHRPELARTRLGLARARLARGRAQDAQPLLELVAREAAEMGMPRLAEVATQLARE